MAEVKVRIPTEAERRKFSARGRKYAAKMNDVAHIKARLEEGPTVLGNLRRAADDVNNHDRQWYENQHMVLSVFLDAFRERLKELEAK